MVGRVAGTWLAVTEVGARPPDLGHGYLGVSGSVYPVSRAAAVSKAVAVKIPKFPMFTYVSSLGGRARRKAWRPLRRMSHYAKSMVRFGLVLAAIGGSKGRILLRIMRRWRGIAGFQRKDQSGVTSQHREKFYMNCRKGSNQHGR